MQPNAEDTGKKIKEAMENNPQDSPSLNIDPESNKPSIVGNPNNIPQGGGNYDITFMYPADMVKEHEKKNMKYDEKTGYYLATVHYKNKRVKPIYRGSLVVRLTNLLTSAGILREDGYKKDLSDYSLGEAFQLHIDDLAIIAKELLGIPEDQIDYISPQSLADFIADLINNEPNILNESYNFLASA